MLTPTKTLADFLAAPKRALRARARAPACFTAAAAALCALPLAAGTASASARVLPSWQSVPAPLVLGGAPAAPFAGVRCDDGRIWFGVPAGHRYWLKSDIDGRADRRTSPTPSARHQTRAAGQRPRRLEHASQGVGTIVEMRRRSHAERNL